jgi:hypothetical protein
MTPSPTQRFIPSSLLYRLRMRPCRRLMTLMRPSHPVRHFWPLRNQRAKVGFAFDSPLEGAGFELLVPPSKRTAVPRARIARF